MIEDGLTLKWFSFGLVSIITEKEQQQQQKETMLPAKTGN